MKPGTWTSNRATTCVTSNRLIQILESCIVSFCSNIKRWVVIMGRKLQYWLIYSIIHLIDDKLSLFRCLIKKTRQLSGIWNSRLALKPLLGANQGSSGCAESKGVEVKLVIYPRINCCGTSTRDSNPWSTSAESEGVKLKLVIYPSINCCGS